MNERSRRQAISALLRNAMGVSLVIGLGALLFLAPWPGRALCPAVICSADRPLRQPPTHADPGDDIPSVASSAPAPSPVSGANPAALSAAAPLTTWLPAYLPRVLAAPQPAFELIAQLGGSSRAVAVRDRTVFVGVGPRVLAFDLRDPDEPVEIGRSPLLPRVVEDIQLDGDLAWIAVGGAGILALDVRSPEAMTVVGSFDTRGRSYSLDVREGIGLLADKGHLLALDVRDPRAIREIGRWPAPDIVHHVTRQGDIAYVTDEHEGLHVLDVTNPAAMQLIEVFDRECMAAGTLVHGTTAYYHSGCAIHVLDVRDPDHITEVGRLRGGEDGGYPDSGMAIAQGRLIADGRLFDLSDPRAPRLVAVFPPRANEESLGWGSDLATAGELVVATRSRDSGFVTADVTDATAPRPRGEWSTLGYQWRENLVGMANEPTLLLGDRRIDVRDPLHPVHTGDSPFKHATGWGGTTLVMRDGWALVNRGYDDTGAFAPLELIALGPPRLSRSIPARRDGRHDWFPDTAAMLGDVAWIAGSRFGWGCPYVTGLDIGDWENPRWVGELDDLSANTTVIETDAATSSVVIGHNNGYCDSYWGNGPGELSIVDASDPAAPVLTDSLVVPSIVRDIETWQGTAYVAAEKAGLRVIDLDGPGAPREVAQLDEDDERALALALQWPYLWLGYSKNLRLIDIREPARPRELMRRDVPSEIMAMTLHHGVLWVATEEAGLLGFRAR